MSNTLGNGKNCYFSLCKITITKCSDAGLGRAAGETMLVTLISGNAIGPAAIPTSLFSQSQSNLSQSSLIANEFNEASSDLRLSSSNRFGTCSAYYNNGYQRWGALAGFKNGKGQCRS
jgi:hypothetical protein